MIQQEALFFFKEDPNFDEQRERGKQYDKSYLIGEEKGSNCYTNTQKTRVLVLNETGNEECMRESCPIHKEEKENKRRKERLVVIKERLEKEILEEKEKKKLQEEKKTLEEEEKILEKKRKRKKTKEIKYST